MSAGGPRELLRGPSLQLETDDARRATRRNLVLGLSAGAILLVTVPPATFSADTQRDTLMD